MNNPDQHFWVFGYGSLMWKPGFQHDAAVPARMSGVHRSPCIYSWVHRGTQDYPGIVLGLDQGGSCRGMAFKVADHDRARVMDYLRERELVTNVYRETSRPAQLDTGEIVACTVFVVRRNHDQYAGRLDHDALVERIAKAQGQSGDNITYFANTVDHMKQMGIRDHALERVVSELKTRSPDQLK
ncbi:MAG: gamma-glutamylcyclotransferase [Ahrensia sp.]|nr:gamma-glutamylcyclotransferase [Ahrensia sp.]